MVVVGVMSCAPGREFPEGYFRSDARVAPDAAITAADAATISSDAAMAADARSNKVPDAALPDAALPDAALPDAALPDAALPDAASPDAALPDAMVVDAPAPADAGPCSPCPILHYSFDGNATNTGELPGIHGVGSNISYAAGRFGQAVHFGESLDSFVTLPGTRDALSDSTDYTIALWFREDLPAKTFTDLLDFRNSDARAGGGFEVYHGFEADKLTTCFSSTGNDQWFGGGCDSFAYSVGSWHHLLFRYDGTSLVPGGGAPLEIYLDGNLVGTVTNTLGYIVFSPNQNQDIVLGAKSGFYIDDLRVYDAVFDRETQCVELAGGVWLNDSCT